MATYFIAPYEPTEDESKWDELRTFSDLKINPEEYKNELLQKWPNTQFIENSGKPLAWWLVGSMNDPAGTGRLQWNQQIVVLGSLNIDFILWHRSLIDAKYQLWLFSDSSWDSIELTKQTTEEDIVKFLHRK